MIVRREFLVRLPRNEVLPCIGKQLGHDFYRDPNESSEFVAVFRANYMKRIEIDNPKLTQKMSFHFYAGNESKFDKAVEERVLEFFRRLRSTSPFEVRVRVVGEFKG